MSVKLIGNVTLGRDAEISYTPSGACVLKFSAASSEHWTGSDGEKHERTTWIRFNKWGKEEGLVKLATYLTKGKTIYVEARLVPDDKGNCRTYERKDGTAGASFEATIMNLEFVSGGKRDEAEAKPESAEAAVEAESTAESSIPF